MLIAQVTNCEGELVVPNVVTFPAAFNGLKAALNYSYSRAGVAQDVVLYEQLPPPGAACGIEASNAVVEIWTEFLVPPEPLVTSDGAADETVEFGQTRLDRGFAYLLNASGLQPVPLQKTWTNILGRYFLIESVPYLPLKPLLDRLQASAAVPPKAELAKRSFPSRKALVANAFGPKSKPIQTAAIRPGRASREKGVLLDYQTLNTSQSNYVFAADTTYYISAPVTLSGSPLFEGGTVIKLAPTNAVGLYFPGTNIWGGSIYRPTLITGRGDNGPGETIIGSTGNPTTNYYGAYALKFNQASAPSYLRISYATEAFQSSANNANLSVSHAQIQNCQYVLDNEGGAGLSATFHNVLLYNDQNVSYNSGLQTYLYGEQVTMDQVPGALEEITVTLTNSLVTAGPLCGGTSNQCLASSSGIYQTVGAASHYLADNSPYRGAGTTNLTAATLAYLSQRTTYPPLILGAITNNTTLWPQAERNFGVPDLGYHYDPLDYCLNGVALTNTLLLTNGVALGMYGSYGITLGAGANLVSQGSPNALNRLVRFASVQELSTNWGNAGTTISLLNLSATYSAWPQVWLRFTDLSFLANVWSKRYILNNNSTCMLSNLVLHDCTVCGGALNMDFEGTAYPPAMSVALTNNQILRPYLVLEQDCGSQDYMVVQAWNNLFQFGSVTFGNYGTTSWKAYDNLFDRGTLPSPSIVNGHNGYITNYNKLSGSSGGDVILTNTPVYQSSWLGNYYYPTNDGMLSRLLQAGSRWATNATLYHYTSTTNQAIEDSLMVNIGFAFVATDTNGIPLCTPGDGIPDYLADTDGNGVYDAGDYCNWQQYYSPNGLTPANGLQVFTPLK